MRLRVYGKKEDINVQGWNKLQKCFSFVGMWEKIENALKKQKENPGYKSSWLESYYELSERIEKDGGVDITEILNMIKYLSEDDAMNLDVYNNGDVDLDQFALKRTHKAFFVNNEDYIDEIKKSCKNMTPQAFNAFMAFLILHLQSGCNIMENELDRSGGGICKNSVELIKYIMSVKSHDDDSVIEENYIALPDEKDFLELPVADEADKKCKMEVVCFCKNEGEITTLDMNGTKKVLFPGERVFAVRRGKGYTAFLPSVAADKNGYMVVEKGKLLLRVVGKKTKEYDMSVFVKNYPINWVFSLENDAIAILNDDGSICSGGYAIGTKKVTKGIKLFAKGGFYAVLNEDGTVCQENDVKADFCDCTEGRESCPVPAWVEADKMIDWIETDKIRVYRKKDDPAWICEIKNKEG